jgi:hypothetical protein
MPRTIFRLDPVTCIFDKKFFLVGALYYCLGDQIEKNEMGGGCSTYGKEERCIQGFGGET